MTNSCEFYTNLREGIGGFTIELTRIMNSKTEDFEKDLAPFPFLIMNDYLLFNKLPENLNNYYSWAALEVKKFLQKQKVHGNIKCIFYSRYFTKEKENHAHTVINCDRFSGDLDAPIWQ